MTEVTSQIEKLRPYVSVHKQELIEKVLDNRTRNITLVLEDIYHPQNASAAIRTSECLGIQDLCFVEDKNQFQVSPRVVHGSSKWVSLHYYSKGEIEYPVAKCIADLRSHGFKIWATSLDAGSEIHDDVPLPEKLAFVFGNEVTGVSGYVKEHADQLVRIPMHGFTDSLNLSVSVGILLHQALVRYKKTFDQWHLSELERQAIKLDWYKKIVRASDMILGIKG